jgi:hypothetical protein
MTKVEITFFIAVECGSRTTRRGWPVGGDDGVNSMLQFRLERGGDGTKCCRKMQQRQRAHLGSMRKYRDTAQLCDDVDRRRDNTREGKKRRRRQLG